MSDNFNTDNKKMSDFYRHNNIFIFYNQNLKVMTPINYSSKTDQKIGVISHNQMLQIWHTPTHHDALEYVNIYFIEIC